ncbi:MAG: cysteine dioxygenase family protein [Planctomycetes bacterium]|jgi:3-mercaptopropionate dioxygenase|nr:cysteine dioxygenase family protein [Planctomycetota bacterium]
MTTLSQHWIADLVERLDTAMQTDDVEERCKQIANELSLHVNTHEGELAAELLQPTVSGYARRLLHLDPSGRYSVVLMVWAEGQGSPLHDHSGRWCVECVYRGSISEQSFTPVEPESQAADVYDFTPGDESTALVGQADYFLPPAEYHVISNPNAATAATIHVYSGEMTECNFFTPIEVGYRKEEVQLAYY